MADNSMISRLALGWLWACCLPVQGGEVLPPSLPGLWTASATMPESAGRRIELLLTADGRGALAELPAVGAQVQVDGKPSRESSRVPVEATWDGGKLIVRPSLPDEAASGWRTSGLAIECRYRPPDLQMPCHTLPEYIVFMLEWRGELTHKLDLPGEPQSRGGENTVR